MASARFAWGIDIGNRALKAIRLSRVGDNLKIDDFDVIEHEQILSNAGDNRESFIQASLANFVQRHNLKGGVVSVGVSGQASFARFIKLPPVEKKQIPNIVRFEAIQQIPFPLEDVEWSYQLFETPESPDVEVGIFAMRKELVARHIQYFTDLDMKVAAVQMNPLAVYNALQHDQRVNETTMVIDMGAENTDLIIADNNSVWLRSIPIGGNSFTEALVKAFKLNFAKAEELKRSAGTSKYTRQIFQAMRPVFADLVSEIQRSMGFFSSVRRETRIKRIIALGGTFRLPNLLRYLQQNLQLEVQRMDSLRAGTPSDAKLTAGFSDNMLSLVGAYGLALQGMGEGKIQSSLLPETIRRERMWREKTKWFAAAAALMLAGTGIAYGSIYMARTGASEASRQQNEAVLSRASDLQQQWAQVETAGAGDRDTIKRLFELTNYRMLWPNLLQDLRGAIPTAQPAVSEGMEKWDAALIKSVPRDERRLVLVQEMLTHYQPQIHHLLRAPDAEFRRMGGAQGGGAYTPPYGGGMGDGMAAAPATPLRGFLITLRCITPHKNGADFIQNEFVKNLLKVRNARPETKKYMVARAAIISSSPLASNQPLLQQIQATYNVLRGDPAKMAAGGGMMINQQPSGDFGQQMEMPIPGDESGYGYGGGYGGGSGTPAAERPKILDPLTEEDVTSDTDVTVLLAVVLDPTEEMLNPPAAAPSGEQQKTPAEPNQ